MEIFRGECIEPFNLHDFFQFDVDKALDEFQQYLYKEGLALTEKENEPVFEEYNIFKSTPLIELKKELKTHITNWGAGRKALSFNYIEMKEGFKNNSLGFTISLLRKT